MPTPHALVQDGTVDAALIPGGAAPFEYTVVAKETPRRPAASAEPHPQVELLDPSSVNPDCATSSRSDSGSSSSWRR
jgi:hypothetical protein